MIGRHAALGNWYDTAATWITPWYTPAKTAATAASSWWASDTDMSQTSAGPLPGDYLDMPGGYAYRLDGMGRITILKSPRGGAGTVVSAATTAGQAILKEMSAYPQNRVDSGQAAPVPTYRPAPTYTPSTVGPGLDVPRGSSGGLPSHQGTVLALTAGIGLVVGLALLARPRGAT